MKKVEKKSSKKKLFKEQEIVFINKIKKGDANARQKFIEHNLYLARHFASSLYKEFNLSNSGIDFDDLYLQGVAGISAAIEGFDTSLGTQFSTYASSFIRRYIIEYLKEALGLIHVPDYKRQTLIIIKNVQRELQQKLLENPSLEQIKNELSNQGIDLTIEEIISYQNLMTNRVYLDESIDKNDSTNYVDLIEDKTSINPADFANNQLRHEMLMEALDCLDIREREIVDLKLGLSRNEELTYEKIGKIVTSEYGTPLSKERIRQLYNRAIYKLKKNNVNLDQFR